VTTVEFVQFLLMLAFGTAAWRLIAHWTRNTSFGPAIAFVTP
jgi:hypothetical protein